MAGFPEIRLSDVTPPAFVEGWLWQRAIDELDDPVISKVVFREVPVRCAHGTQHGTAVVRCLSFDQEVLSRVSRFIENGGLDLDLPSFDQFGDGDDDAPWAQDPNAWRQD